MKTALPQAFLGLAIAHSAFRMRTNIATKTGKQVIADKKTYKKITCQVSLD
jgi:hypothetical protein